MNEHLLFEACPPRRGRLALMIGVSVVVHSGLVLIGALWPQKAMAKPMAPPLLPPPPVRTTDVFEPPAGGPNDVLLVVTINTPKSPDEPMPTEPAPAVVDPAAPASITPEIEAPASKPVPQKPQATAIRHTPGPVPPGAARGDAPQAGMPGGANTAATGSTGGLGWYVPAPKYPPAATLAHVQGTTVIRVTTDSAGSVASAVVVKSAGSVILDSWSTAYARANWHGPANSTFTRTYEYRLP